LGHNTSLMDFRRGALLESNFEIRVGRGPTPALRPARVFISVGSQCNKRTRNVKDISGGCHRAEGRNEKNPVPAATGCADPARLYSPRTAASPGRTECKRAQVR
jgi:hypothetical protein